MNESLINTQDLTTQYHPQAESTSQAPDPLEPWFALPHSTCRNYLGPQLRIHFIQVDSTGNDTHLPNAMCAHARNLSACSYRIPCPELSVDEHRSCYTVPLPSSRCRCWGWVGLRPLTVNVADLLVPIEKEIDASIASNTTICIIAAQHNNIA